MPSRGMRWRRTRCLGGRLRRGLLSPAPDQDAPQGGPADVDAVALAQQLAEMRVVGPCVSGTSQVNHGSLQRARVLRWVACGHDDRERRRQRPSLDKPPGCAWCGEW